MRKLLLLLPLLLAAQTKVQFPTQVANGPMYVYPTVSALPTSNCSTYTPFAIVGDTLYQNQAVPPACGWQAYTFNNTPNLFGFGCKGDGVTDDTTCIQKAVNALQGLAVPGNVLNVPTTVTFCTGSILIKGSLTITGGGTLKRCKVLPPNQGLLDITATGVSVIGPVIQGQVTTPQFNIDYKSPPTPYDAGMTANTSIWIHGGSSNVLIQGMTINHTGGYAIFVDARAANISHISVLGNTVSNSRSSVAGTSGDFNYGGWTGGLLWSNDGVTYSINDMVIDGNRMLQVSGNTIWGHSSNSALALQNTGVRVTSNWFEDCGLDCIQIQNVNGGLVAHNNGKRVGYLSLVDNTPGIPRWAPSADTASGLFSVPAVALDTTALVTGVDYEDNNFDAINGGWIDGDGFGSGTVRPGTGTSCWYSTDPFAQSGSCGPAGIAGNPNYSYGWNSGNSSGSPLADVNVSIIGGQFNGFGGGAIKIYGCQRCKVIGTNINHPPPTGYPSGFALYHPIEWGPFTIGSTPIYPTNNVVTDNTAYWQGPGSMIAEDAEYTPFISSNSTIVARNTCVPLNGGSCYEINKDPTTATSSGPEVLSSVTPGACPFPFTTPFPICQFESHIQTEGSAVGSLVLNFYSDVGGTGQLMASMLENGGITTPGPVGAGTFVQPGALLYAQTPCNGTNEYAIQWIRDSTTNTPGGTISGGGSDKVLGVCNGTNWLVLFPNGGGGGGITYQADGTELTQSGTNPVTFSANTAVMASRLSAAQALDTTCQITSGSSSAYTGAMRGNAYSAGYADGMRVLVEPDVTTGGGAITLNCGSGAKPVYQNDGATNPTATQWASGQQVLVAYGGALNAGAGGWRILGGGASVTDSDYTRYYTVYDDIGSGNGPTGPFEFNSLYSPPTGGMTGAPGSPIAIYIDNSGNDYVQWLGKIPSTGWTGAVNLKTFFTITNYSTGTGTGSHDYTVACFTPGTSNITSALSFSTAVNKTFNFTGSAQQIGQVDNPTLNLPTCVADDKIVIRMTRTTSGTAVDRSSINYFDVALPRTVN